MNVEKLNSSVPGLAEDDSIHDNLLDYLESVTKEVEIYSSDDPTVRQIKTLTKELLILKKELASKDLGGKAGSKAVQPKWVDAIAPVTDASNHLICLSYHPPQCRDSKVVVCSPQEVVDLGSELWSEV